MLKGILFDLDNTLVDSDLAYAESLRKVGIDPLADSYRHARTTVKERLGFAHPSARNRLLYFKEMLQRSNAFSAEKVLSLMEEYEAEIVAQFRSQWQKLGRAKLFESLASRFPLVILTNENTRTQLLKIAAIDPKGEIFRRVITSEEVGVEKPDAAIFRAGFAALSAQPGECLMVGDDWDSDIVPALKTGASAVWTTEFRKAERKALGCAQINHLSEIEQVLP